MLKRIRGTVISFYQSRISKVLAPVIVAALTLLLFLSGSVRAYASNEDSNITGNGISTSYSYISTSMNWEPVISVSDNYNSSGNNFYSYTDVGYFDIYVRINESFSLNPSTDYSGSYKYYGFFQSYGTFYIDVTLSSGTVLEVMYLDSEHSIPRDYINSSSTYLQSSITNGKRCTLSRNEIFYENGNNFVINSSSGPVYNRSIYRFRCFVARSASNLGIGTRNVSVNVVTTPTGRGNIFRYNSSDYYLYNINSHLKNGQSNILNVLENDSIGTSDNMNSIRSSYNSVQESADTAVDSAIHSYSNDLQQVEEVDFSSFFNTQRYGLNFWRSVGEFILDSSNLGYIATGLIVVTVINLFVFLLRL